MLQAAIMNQTQGSLFTKSFSHRKYWFFSWTNAGSVGQFQWSQLSAASLWKQLQRDSHPLASHNLLNPCPLCSPSAHGGLAQLSQCFGQGPFLLAKDRGWLGTQSALFKKVFPLPWLVWLNGLSTGLQTKGSLVQFPVRAHSWVAGQVPSGGAHER